MKRSSKERIARDERDSYRRSEMEFGVAADAYRSDPSRKATRNGAVMVTVVLALAAFLAVLALKSSHPFSFLLAALVFIVDGSLGILKISLKRFLHISILKNTRTPLHDHVRKRLGWSDEQVVARWLILQAVASAWLLLLVR